MGNYNTNFLYEVDQEIQNEKMHLRITGVLILQVTLKNMNFHSMQKVKLQMENMYIIILVAFMLLHVQKLVIQLTLVDVAILIK